MGRRGDWTFGLISLKKAQLAVTDIQDPKSKETKDMPSWEIQERIVALLEQSLDKNARIKHNWELPDLSTGHKCQFDVVIWQGKPPRETISVVEVQKRKEKPTINDFRGWIGKKDGVGAQHLICVSELGYPESVIDAVAKKHGPSVRLMTLRDLEDPEIFNRVGITGIVERHLYFDEVRIGWSPKYLKPRRKAKFASTMRLKRNGILEDTTLEDLMRGDAKLKSLRDHLKPGKHPRRIVVKSGINENLYAEINGKWIELSEIRLEYTIEYSARTLPLSAISYAQHGHEEDLRWVCKAVAEHDGKSVEMCWVMRCDERGMFWFDAPEVFNAPPSLRSDGFVLSNS